MGVDVGVENENPLLPELHSPSLLRIIDIQSRLKGLQNYYFLGEKGIPIKEVATQNFQQKNGMQECGSHKFYNFV